MIGEPGGVFGDFCQGGADPVADRLPRPLDHVAAAPGPPAEAVGRGKLRTQELDLRAKPLHATEVGMCERFVELVLELPETATRGVAGAPPRVAPFP